MTDWNANGTTFGYTDDGKLRSVASADGSTVTYAYDDADLPASGTFAPGDSSAPTVWNLTRKDSGRLSGAADGSTATGAYDYDPIGQLAVDTVASATAGYDYDAAGNLTGLPDGTSFAGDDASQLTSATPASGPATSFTYDALGERTSATVAGGASRTYGWDAAGGLTSVTPSSGVATTFGYDGDGLRSSTTVGAGTAQRFAYDTVTGANALILSDGTNEYLYGPGDLPVEQVALAGGATHYLHTDGLGDVRTMTDPSGQVTGAQSFTPFGVRATSTGTATPFGYRAQYRDASTGLVWLRARFYDPATARFLSVDPLVESTRAPYAYAGNDPLDNIDPSGLNPLSDGLQGISNWAYTNLSSGTGAVVGKTLVSIGNGATFGATHTIDEQLSPGAGCYFDRLTGVYRGIQAVSGAGTILITAGAGAQEVIWRTLVSEPWAAGDVALWTERTGGVGFRSNTSHIFLSAAGHLTEDTAANRALLRGVVKDANFVETRPGGVSVFRETLADGRQLWVEVRNGNEITNGGVNLTPRN